MNSKKNMHIAALLKSIGHPIRIQIIRVLTNNSSMSVSDLSLSLSIDQPVMSLHLAVLRKYNVIKAVKRGKQSFYYLSDINIQQIVNIAYYAEMD